MERATFDDARAAARDWRAKSYFATRSQQQQCTTTSGDSSGESSESEGGGAGAPMDESD